MLDIVLFCAINQWLKGKSA